MSRHATVLALITACLGLMLGGCDKCGNRVHFNSPSIQHVCGDNSESGQ